MFMGSGCAGGGGTVPRGVKEFEGRFGLDGVSWMEGRMGRVRGTEGKGRVRG